MRIISTKKLREFWNDSKNAAAEGPLRAWIQTVKKARWKTIADVRNTYNTADSVGNKVVFNIGGNKYRLIAVIDYDHHKVFIRWILDHKEYDQGHWRSDTFGDVLEERKKQRAQQEAQERRKPEQSRKRGRKR
jgi:mRNA interferase HigB